MGYGVSEGTFCSRDDGAIVPISLSLRSSYQFQCQDAKSVKASIRSILLSFTQLHLGRRRMLWSCTGPLLSKRIGAEVAWAKFKFTQNFDTLHLHINVQSLPSHHAERFFGFFLESSLGLWAATAASYCPSRAGELPKDNPKTLSA